MAYYFISIGGSGAKVLEALTHLCVAGAMPTREDLNILAIDPDSGNGNLERSGSALNQFIKFQNLSVGNDTPLFKTKMTLIKPLPWNPIEIDKTLDDLIGFQIYKNSALGSLYEVLYTRRERNTKLNEGFRGHPSIGAAVLAKKYTLRDNRNTQWTDFIQKIKQDTNNGGEIKIFFAGSVFGGTGASGIPTIARLLRNDLSKNDDNSGVRKIISIGGAFILPYFSFTPPADNDKLFAHSENFLTNTKAALKYYAQRDNVFNAMYFLGDSHVTHFKRFSIGAATQKNDAHIVDFYGALAAIDFFNQPADNSRVYNCIFHGDNDKFSWSDFPALEEIENGDAKNFDLRKRFAKFARFIFAYVHFIKPVLRGLASGDIKDYQYPWYVDYFKDIDVVNTGAVKNFEDYTESFVTWLKQLETLPDREVALIKSSMFAARPAQIVNAEDFSSCDGVITKPELTLHEIWYRLSEDFKIYAAVNGYGKFLRRLYEACDAEI